MKRKEVMGSVVQIHYLLTNQNDVMKIKQVRVQRLVTADGLEVQSL